MHITDEFLQTICDEINVDLTRIFYKQLAGKKLNEQVINHIQKYLTAKYEINFDEIRKYVQLIINELDGFAISLNLKVKQNDRIKQR